MTAEQRATLKALPSIEHRLLASFHLDDATHRFWDDPQNHFVHPGDGRRFLAAGAIADFSGRPQSRGMTAARFTITLDGSRMLAAGVSDDPGAILRTYQTEKTRNRELDIEHAIFHPDTGAFLFSFSAIAGILTGSRFIGDFDAGTALLEIECATLSALLGRANGGVRNHQDQQRYYPGDNGLSLVNASARQELNLDWGGKTAGAFGQGPGAGGRDRISPFRYLQ